MLHGKRIIVVMPAYNAEKTLESTYHDVPKDIVDEVILVDDGSRDSTAEVARRLGITTIVHTTNRGYGANQKTCYKTAIDHGADVIVMVHPDYQYDPHLILPMAAMIVDGPYKMVIGSRITGQIAGSNMPRWRYVANRFLTIVENVLLGAKLSEYHTGYRAFDRGVLESLPLHRNSEDFVFDNEILAQVIMKGYPIGEVSCPARYFAEASSINFRRSVRYGFGVLRVSLVGFLHRWGIHRSRLFGEAGEGGIDVQDPNLRA
jgi:glycosyltransferase involved in cell wall biosynthesis